MNVQYPIGQYVSKDYSETLKNDWLTDIRMLPDDLEAAISGLNEEQMQTPYREGGWTVHQLVHHVADSHTNAYCRFKLGYTESNPTICPYEEKLWAETADVKNLPVNVSLLLLHAIHRRWFEFMKSFSKEDFGRTIYHPEHQRDFTLWHLLGMYAWHGRHHTTHIVRLIERMTWRKQTN